MSLLGHLQNVRKHKSHLVRPLSSPSEASQKPLVRAHGHQVPGVVLHHTVPSRNTPLFRPSHVLYEPSLLIGHSCPIRNAVAMTCVLLRCGNEIDIVLVDENDDSFVSS
jgi:hypothetical protein